MNRQVRVLYAVEFGVICKDKNPLPNYVDIFGKAYELVDYGDSYWLSLEEAVKFANTYLVQAFIDAKLDTAYALISKKSCRDLTGINGDMFSQEQIDMILEMGTPSEFENNRDNILLFLHS